MRHLPRAVFFSLVAATLCAVACGTAQPTSPPQPPPPNPVTAKPEQLVLPFDRFPFTGYAPPQDTVESDGTIRRRFVPTSFGPAGYGNIIIDVTLLNGSLKTWIEGADCKWNGGNRTPVSNLEIKSPTAVGAAGKACVHRFDDNTLYTYTSGVRNVGLFLQANIKPASPAELTAVDFLASLADRQITFINQVAPALPLQAGLAGASFQFDPPANLPPAQAGKPYPEFSFCLPSPATHTTACGPFPQATTPSGGAPPYHFQVERGFPPFGLYLLKDGQFYGTPHASTGGQTYPFTVCAVDLRANAVCRDVSILVEASIAPTPTPAPTARPTSTTRPTPTATPAPTPKPVDPKALLEQYDRILTTGYTASKPEQVDQYTWSMEYKPTAADGVFESYVLVFSALQAGESVEQFVNTDTCDLRPQGVSVVQLAVPMLGDATRACVYEKPDGTLTFLLVSGTKNVGVALVAETKSRSPSSYLSLLNIMAIIVDHQLLLVRSNRPDWMYVRTGTPPFEFNPSATLPPAEAGKDYLPEFSFCLPAPATHTTACGPFPPTSRPSGGAPPYHFQVESGFPPFGMYVLKDGQLYGKPDPATAGKTYEFTVCAVDLKADYVCRDVSITVNAPARTPTPRPPTPLPPTPTLARIAPSATITSLTCTPVPGRVRADGQGDYTLTASGTATGNVGDTLHFATRRTGQAFGNIPEVQSQTGGWTGTQGVTWRSDRKRQAGEPETINWTVQVTEYWDSSPTLSLVVSVAPFETTATCRR